jgi:hypothetical protein
MLVLSFYAAVACLVVAATVSQVITLTTHHDSLLGLLPKFDLNGERNIPAWFSSSALCGCAAMLAVIAFGKHQRADPLKRYWAGLAVVFTLLSIDEFVSLHELLNVPLRQTLNASGAFYFPWVIVALALCALLGAVYAPFLRRLDPPLRTRLLLSAAVYLSGSIGMEMVAARLYEAQEQATLAHLASVTIEETLEMIGVGIFLSALLDESARCWPLTVIRPARRSRADFTAGPGVLDLPVEPGAIRRWVGGAVCALLIVSLGLQAAKYGLGVPLGRSDRVFNVALEGSIPTWLSAILLLSTSILCGLLAAASRSGARVVTHGWLLLAALLGYMSMDEAAALHELTVRPLRRLLGASGVLYYAWVIPGALVVIAVAVYLRGWFRMLPPRTRSGLIVAAVVFVSGGLVVEALSGWYASLFGREHFAYAIFTTVEEGGEMFGVTLFLAVLLEHAADRITRVRLVLSRPVAADAVR